MASFRFVVEVFASPERVFEVLTDVEHWPEWTQTVTSVQRLDAGAFAVGSRTKVVQPKLIPTVWEVTQLDRKERIFSWTTGRPGIKITGTHLVERSPRGSLVTMNLDYTGLLGALMAAQLKNLNWDYLTKEAEGLKHRCETSAAVAMV